MTQMGLPNWFFDYNHEKTRGGTILMAQSYILSPLQCRDLKIQCSYHICQSVKKHILHGVSFMRQPYDRLLTGKLSRNLFCSVF